VAEGVAVSALRQWGGTMIDCGAEVQDCDPAPSARVRVPLTNRRDSRRTHTFRLANGETVTTRSLYDDARNVSGVTPDAFRSRLKRGENDPERIFWSERRYRRWRKEHA